jgi:hypothetical protein
LTGKISNRSAKQEQLVSVALTLQKYILVQPVVPKQFFLSQQRLQENTSRKIRLSFNKHNNGTKKRERITRSLFMFREYPIELVGI